MIHEEYLSYVKENLDLARQLLITLSQIPSPSNQEQRRAAFVKAWLEEQGAQGVFIDEAMNVVWPVGCAGSCPVTVYMAHTDVVFPDTDPLPLTVGDGKICCPGVGDDTANLVGLLLAARYVLQKGCTPKPGQGVVFVANSGEEGLGNLKGSRQICRTFAGRIRALYSFDGYYGGVCNNAVGSERYRVEVTTEGGHSFGAFGNRNAIAYLASMIGTLYELKPPVSCTKTTYNVGTICGGTSVNTIAQQAEMLYEYRSDSREDLEFMRRHFEAVVESYRAKGIGVQVELLGQRPCKGAVDEAALDALTGQVCALTAACTGHVPEIRAMSTDCNIPLSQGIPAVCVGVIDGGGAHTRQEYVLLDSMEPGYHLALELVLSSFA